MVHDVMGRLTSSTKAGVSASGSYAAQGDIMTTNTYDAYNRLLSSTVAAGTLSITTSRQYERTGRVLVETDSASLNTTYSYSTGSGGGNIITVTRPGGFTEVSEYFRDGRVKSRTGTAIVAEYDDYGVNTNGSQWTKVITGVSSGPRYGTTSTDMLGRQTQSEQPAFSGATIVSTSVYSAIGRLAKTTRTGQADTLFEYDSLGNPTRSGLDCNTNGALDLASNDRISESDTSFSQIGSDWWSVTTSKTYPTAGSGTAITTGVQRQKLTGLGGCSRWSESVDIAGNVTTSNTQIDRSSKLVTETVDVPDSSSDEKTITRNGLAQLSQSRTGLTTTFGYDGLGRRTGVTDPRTGTSTTHYDSAGRVDYVENAAGNRTSYAFDGTTGRLSNTSDALSKKTYYSYNARGQTTRIWGDVPQPVEMGFDSTYGERTTLSTFRGGSGWTGSTWPTSPGTADTTTWTFHAATGLLTAKTYADGSAVGYTYNSANRLGVRTWARTSGGSALTTTYSYDALTGEMTAVDYSDSTPDVAMTYNRFGAMATASESGVTTHTFSYSSTTLAQTSEAITGLYSKTLSRSYATTGVIGRPTKLTIGTEYETDYDYDATGRLNRITGPGLPGSGSTGVSPVAGSGAAYSFATSSDLVGQIDFKSDANTNVATTIRSFESNRDLIASVENKWGTTSVSKYAYVSDAVARRASVVNTGTAFSTSRFTLWTYNDRSELLSSRRYNGTNINDISSPVTWQQFTYGFDNIGNRTNDTGDPGVTTYNANNLNQYTSTAGPSETFGYDLDGNLTAERDLTLVWDAENRLLSATPTANSAIKSPRKIECVYDYMGRRVRKRVYGQDAGGSWTVLDKDVKFVYDGWNLIEELDALNSDAVTRRFTWGLDLSGQSGNAAGGMAVPPVGIHGAGGIGGLLSMADVSASKNYIYFYNANGDVGQVIDTNNGPTAVRYEYYPYGGLMVGANDTINPLRFSTKYWDPETQTYYYGYRFHKPRIGRWLSRDPIFVLRPPVRQYYREPRAIGSLESNINAIVSNLPISVVDPLGLEMTLNPSGHSTPGPCGKYKYQWYITFGPDGAPCSGWVVQEVHVNAQCLKCTPPKSKPLRTKLESAIDGDLVYWEAFGHVNKGDHRAQTDFAQFTGRPSTTGHNNQTGEVRLFCDSPEIGDLKTQWPTGYVGDIRRCTDKDGKNPLPWTTDSFPHTTDRPAWWDKNDPTAGIATRSAWARWDCCCGGINERGASPWSKVFDERGDTGK